MPKKPLRCFTKEANDGHMYTACIEPYKKKPKTKKADKIELKKKPKFVVKSKAKMVAPTPPVKKKRNFKVKPKQNYLFWHEDAERIHKETGKIPKKNPYDDVANDLVWFNPNDEASGMRFKKSKKHDTPFYVRLDDGYITYNKQNKRDKFFYYE